ncbi:MAG: NADH-quinone oxidoreductase subunit C [Candidatus Kariarchaeaceae archaeon]|jgi:NADH-quinone oxidoreductase subunit C
MLTEQEIIDKLTSEFGSQISETKSDQEHRINVYVNTEGLIDVANYIKHDLGFTYPNMCTGVDHKDHIEVLWHIGYPKGPVFIVLRVKTERDQSNVPSLTNIWEGFNWHEREAFEMVGVQFVDHPDLRKLILPENWEGYPLREDYVYKKPKYRKLEDL